MEDNLPYNGVPNNLEIGERIRKIREELKMNRERFSEMIDVSDVFLGQIERGERSLSLRTLFRIVSFTGCSTDYVLFGNTSGNSTIDKIDRILSHCSEANVEYFYNLMNCSHIFFKTYKNDLNQK